MENLVDFLCPTHPSPSPGKERVYFPVLAPVAPLVGCFNYHIWKLLQAAGGGFATIENFENLKDVVVTLGPVLQFCRSTHFDQENGAKASFIPLKS